MDKDKFTAPSSWLEMSNFIGDLMASRASNSAQLLKSPNQQSLFTTWGTSGLEASMLKSAHPGSRTQAKSMAGVNPQSGERAEQPADCDDQQILTKAFTCPGCPLSSSTAAPSSQSLCPRSRNASTTQQGSAKQGLSQAKEPNSVPGPGLSPCFSLALSLEHRNSELSSTSHPEHQDKGTSTQSPTPAPNSSLQICPSPVKAFPCFCCHRKFHSCPHFLQPQKGSKTHFAHTHPPYHHHHHQCPLAACLLCQRSLSTCTQQEGHVQLQHQCMHCSASFVRPSQLLHHQRTQHSSKTCGFLCSECGRVFNSHSNLRVHLNVHTGARPFTCAECGKSFSQSGALKIHQRMHTGERPYTCTYCGRGFPHLAGVRAHQRIHTGEKPYRCVQCDKGFTQSGALKVHMRIHTGERPFICGLCGKGFSNRSGVRFHQRTAHGIITEPNSVGRPSLAGGDVMIRQRQDDPMALTRPKEHTVTPNKNSSDTAGVKRLLLYGCEDCGKQFPDAPSRNRHQEQEHYPNEKEQSEGSGNEEEAQEVEKHLI